MDTQEVRLKESWKSSQSVFRKMLFFAVFNPILTGSKEFISTCALIHLKIVAQSNLQRLLCKFVVTLLKMNLCKKGKHQAAKQRFDSIDSDAGETKKKKIRVLQTKSNLSVHSDYFEWSQWYFETWKRKDIIRTSPSWQLPYCKFRICGNTAFYWVHHKGNSEWKSWWIN